MRNKKHRLCQKAGAQGRGCQGNGVAAGTALGIESGLRSLGRVPRLLGRRTDFWMSFFLFIMSNHVGCFCRVRDSLCIPNILFSQRNNPSRFWETYPYSFPKEFSSLGGGESLRQRFSPKTRRFQRPEVLYPAISKMKTLSCAIKCKKKDITPLTCTAIYGKISSVIIG